MILLTPLVWNEASWPSPPPEADALLAGHTVPVRPQPHIGEVALSRPSWNVGGWGVPCPRLGGRLSHSLWLNTKERNPPPKALRVTEP